MVHRTHRNPSAGWIVAFAGLGVNLALGVLYSWSVFAAALRVDGWSATQTQLPYMIACAVFAVLMVPGGRLQDRYGPKPVLQIAAILTGTGFVFSGLLLSLSGLIVCFGILFGTGMAFGYSATTPAAIKWFGPQRRGLISGIVVSGFGLAGIYVAPLTTFLLHAFSLKITFIALGVFYCIVIYLLHFLIRNPPGDYVPPRLPDAKAAPAKRPDYSAKEMIRTYQFYLLWLMFFCGTFAGLKILGQLSNIGKEQAGLALHETSIIIMVYSLFNFIGRFVSGILSDRIGRRLMLFVIFLIQVAALCVFSKLSTLVTLSIGTAFIAFSFGGMLSLFPSLTADYFGLKNLGLNYGFVFTAWGVGGILGPLVGGIVRDQIGGFHIGYLVSVMVSLVGLVLCLFVKEPKRNA